MKVALVIPSLNGGERFRQLLESVSLQNLPLIRKIVIDSGSIDHTVILARHYGFEVVSIPPEEFNHGATRQKVVDMVPEADVVVFLTQDVILADELAISHLMAGLEQDTVGIAYGRQLPHHGATAVETYARLCNYPDESCIKSLADAPRSGIKTVFCSNSFAAYRCSALQQIGGFPQHTILGEDMYVAAKMILAGWSMAYCAQAQAYHSHRYTMAQEFKRYFDIGVFQSRESWIQEQFGQAEGEGFRYVISEWKYLWVHHHKSSIPTSFLHNIAKYLGYRLGFIEAKIPIQLKRMISMHHRYWKKKEGHDGGVL
jgi:rhamnosyltransferase